MAVLVAKKIHFKAKKLTRNKQGDFITIKGSIQEDNIVLNTLHGSSKIMKQKLIKLKQKVNLFTIQHGVFNIPLLVINSSVQKKKLWKS